MGPPSRQPCPGWARLNAKGTGPQEQHSGWAQPEDIFNLPGAAGQRTLLKALSNLQERPGLDLEDQYSRRSLQMVLITTAYVHSRHKLLRDATWPQWTPDVQGC